MFRIASLQLVFDVLAKDNASSTFRQVGDSAGKAGKQAEAGLGRVSGAAKMLGGALLGAGIISGFKSLFDAADESARITARTENVISHMGNAAKISAKDVGDLAGAIAAKTGVDDEAIQSGQNLLLTFGNIRNEAGKGNDIFNQTSQLMVDMSVAMGKDASGSAIQLGKALNDPVKGITALSKAGVSFTEQQKEQIKTLVEAGDTLGAQKIILGELEKQFGGAAEAMGTPLDRAKVAVGNLAEEMGGYLLPIVGDAADGLLALIDGFKGGETSADGFVGAMETTGSVLKDVVTFLGDVGGVVGDVVEFFAAIPGPVLLGVGALTAFVALKGPISAVFDTIALKALYASEAVGAAGFAGAASGLVGFLGGPWGLAIAGATIGLGFLASALMSSGDATDDTAELTAQATAAQESFADAIKESSGLITDNLRLTAAKTAQDAGLLDIVEQTGRSTMDLTDALLGNRDAYDNVKAGIEQYISQQTLLSVGTGEGAQKHRENADAARAQLGVLDQLVGTYPAAVAEQKQLTEAVTGTTGTVDTFTAGLEAASEAASDASRETNMLKTALDILTGASVSMIEVESSYQAALADASGALKDLNGTVLNGTSELNTHSEAGRAAADVLLGVRDSGNQLIATMVQQGKTSDEVGAAEARLRQDFINTAIGMGIGSDAAGHLADQILGIPDQRRTTITADTGPAVAEINALVDKIRNAGGRVIYTGADIRNVAGVSARATGGIIYGPGTGTSDSILGIDRGTGAATSWVSAGEFVVNKKATDANRPLIEAINAGHDLKYLAGGGILDGLYRVPLGLSGGTLADLERKMTPPAGALGGGSLGGSWQSIFNAVKAAIPQARQNSTYRPGDPGYHGRNKAVDFGYGSGPGGNGSAGLASINRFLHDNYGGNLAELIYDGIGDDRPDLKNGRPLTYSASTRAQHHNHVHAAVYDQGGTLPPGFTMAFNGTGKNETIRTAEQERGLSGGGPVHVTLRLDGAATTQLLDGRVVTVVDMLTNRGQYNG